MTNGRERGESLSGEATLQNELQSLAGMLDRRKWLIVASVIATMALALLFTLRQEKVYSSSAIIGVSVPASGAASQTDQATAAASAAGSQIVVVSSSGYREAAARAIEADRKADATTALETPITTFQLASRVSANTVGQT